jgi:GABA permease
MRNPIRSETDAFYLTFGVALVLVAAAAVGALAGALVGVAVIAAAAVGALIWELSTKDPERRRPLREAAAEGRLTAPAHPRRRVLVVANRTLQGDELTNILRRRAEAGAELRVVAPILVSRTRYLASDVDRELADARERLGAALDWAQAEGVQASGRVGDPIAAFGAIEDELRVFAADEIVISTFPEGRSNWLETDIVERLRDELDIPITHVISDDGQPSARTKRRDNATAR